MEKTGFLVGVNFKGTNNWKFLQKKISSKIPLITHIFVSCHVRVLE